MSIDLWISVALAIPLAIAANIITPRVQGLLDTRLSHARERKATKRYQKRKTRLKVLKRQLAEAEYLQSDKANLTHHYLNALLTIAFLGGAGSVYATIFSFLSAAGRWDTAFIPLGRLSTQLITLVIAVSISLTCIQAVRVANRVKNFSEYKQNTEKLIADLRRSID